ncbi:MAG: hypothetical protein ACRC7S_10750 [Cetobacterium sp.]|uniref:hypothetical protein n=1 Tax=unclassified Cetobacterium TaxID=2630983 RepID=UPI0006477F41|nr:MULTISPECIES: hypothetical protein [unclassified Cetobacterium]
MKKILTLLSLTLSMTAFANSVVQSDTMNINAKIVKPLTVSHDGHIQFGNLVQNSGHSEKVSRNFFINGTPGQKIEFKINDQKLDSFSNSHLTRVGGSETLDFYTSNRKVTNGDISNPTLDNNGNLTFSFDSVVNVTNLPVGEYTGSLKVAVKYN